MKKIFDIGFNIGEFSRACRLKYPSCEVVAVEANSNLIPSFPPEWQRSIELLNLACSDKRGEEINFYLEKTQSGISTASLEFINNSRFTKGSKFLQPDSAMWSKPIKVQTTTLDSLIERYGMPDLIKVDVEGHELAVVNGLSKPVSKICLEWIEEDYDSLIGILNRLEYIGYKEFGIIGYFEETNLPEELTHSDEGDPYLSEPKKYLNKDILIKILNNYIVPERRINYGMIYARDEKKYQKPIDKIPEDMLNAYSMGGSIDIKYSYRDDSTPESQDEMDKNYTKEVCEDALQRISMGQHNYYGATDLYLYEAFKEHPIKNKNVCVMGSAHPWYEIMCIFFGAKSVAVIEYSKRKSFHEKISYFQPHEKINFKFDACLSISSFEHDGLGRYGDPLNPNGDLEAMKKIKQILNYMCFFTFYVI